MDGDVLINAIWNACETRTAVGKKNRQEMLNAMREILRGEGEYVAENARELKALALTETDLVEPGDE